MPRLRGITLTQPPDWCLSSYDPLFLPTRWEACAVVPRSLAFPVANNRDSPQMEVRARLWEQQSTLLESAALST